MGMVCVIPSAKRPPIGLLYPTKRSRGWDGTASVGVNGAGRFGWVGARDGIEPPMKVLQTFALPLGYRACSAVRYHDNFRAN